MRIKKKFANNYELFKIISFLLKKKEKMSFNLLLNIKMWSYSVVVFYFTMTNMLFTLF